MTLPREVIKWTQSLDLSWQIVNPKRDLSNGYIFGEIFCWYYPNEINMYCFNKGSSFSKRSINWDFLKDFLKKQKISVDEDLITGTIHFKDRCATNLLIYFFELFTHRKLPRPKNVPDISDQTNFPYQMELPMHARTTASLAVKNNIAVSEIVEYKSVLIGATADEDDVLDPRCPRYKAKRILFRHLKLREMERLQNPKRFSVKSAVGNMAKRKVLPQIGESTVKTNGKDKLPGSTTTTLVRNSLADNTVNTVSFYKENKKKENFVSFKMIKVKQ